MSQQSVITKYFSSTAENTSKRENSMKDFKDESKEISNQKDN